jgi:hypothetical protein
MAEDIPIPDIGNFAKGQIAYNEAERRRQAAAQAAALTGLIGAGNQARGGDQARSGDQARGGDQALRRRRRLQRCRRPSRRGKPDVGDDAITDKIIEHERVSGNTLNAPLNSGAALTSSSSSAPPPPQTASDPTVEALQKQQQKRKDKGKGKGKGASEAVSGDNIDNGNVNASDVAVVPPTRRPSNGKKCQFCDRSGHVESECFSKKARLKHGQKIASASALAMELFSAPHSRRNPIFDW